MLKRIVSVCLVMAMCLTMLLCTGGCSEGLSLFGGDKDKDGKITLVVTQGSSELGDTKLYEKYMKDHPNIIIEESRMSNSDTKLVSMIASGNPPDIIRCMGFDEIPVFVQRGILMPLDDYISKSENINLDDFYDVIDVCRYNGTTRGEGSLYALPKDWSPMGLWINKKAFNEVGIPLPSTTVPMSWDEFGTIAKKLVKMKNGAVNRHGVITALAFPTLLEMYLNSYGKSFWTEDFSATTVKSNDTVNAIKFFMDLQKSAAINNTLYPSSDGIGFSALREDKVGMALGGYWFIGAYRSNNAFEEVAEDLMFVPAPVGTKKSSYVLDLTCVGIFSETEYPEEAYDLWEYMMLEEYAVTARSKIGFGLPINKQYFDTLPNKTDLDKQALNTVTEYQFGTLDLSPQICPYIAYSSISALFDKYYLPVLYGREKLDKALATIDKEAKILIKEGKTLVED